MKWLLMRSVPVVAVGLILAAPGAAHADGEYIRVTPSTIQAGFQVEIEAFCGDNVNPATVRSDAFGVITITPQPDPKQPGKYLHRGTATIPQNKKPKAYPVTMTCPSNQSATTTLHVVNHNLPSKGPKTGGGYLASQPFNGSGLTMIGLGSAAAVAGAFLLVFSRRRQRA